MHYLFIRTVDNQLDKAMFDAMELLSRIKVTSVNAYPNTPVISPIMTQKSFAVKAEMSYYVMMLVYSRSEFRDAQGNIIPDGQVVMPAAELDKIKKGN